MREKLTWASYSSRRGITLEDYMRNLMPVSYKMIAERLSDLWVLPPTPEEFSEAIDALNGVAIENSDDDAASSKPALAKKSSSQKKSLSKKEDPQEVWEDAEAAAYQTKKTTQRKASTRKTTQRKTSTRKTTTKKKST